MATTNISSFVYFSIKKQKECKCISFITWLRVSFSVKKVVLKNFAIFTEKHLCCSLFLICVKACNFIKKTLQHRCFPMNIAKFLRTPILRNIWEQLLLETQTYITYPWSALLSLVEKSLIGWFINAQKYIFRLSSNLGPKQYFKILRTVDCYQILF